VNDGSSITIPVDAEARPAGRDGADAQ